MLKDVYTKDDARKAWKKFPPEICELFPVLWQEVVRLNAKWRLYDRLFADREAVHVLASADTHAFGSIQADMRDAIVLTLSRLLDRSQLGRNRNITLERLVNACEQFDATLTENLRSELDIIRDLCHPVTTVRNKTIAHSDLDVELDSLEVSRHQTEDGIRVIIDLMNAVERHFTGTDTPYTSSGASTGKRLLSCLKAGLASSDP